MPKFDVKCNVYDSVILHVFYNVDYPVMENYISKIHKGVKVTNSNFISEAGCIIQIDGDIYIWLGSFDKVDDDILQSIMHECGHASFKTLAFVDVPVKTPNNEEAFLYLHGFYVKNILEKLKNKMK